MQYPPNPQIRKGTGQIYGWGSRGGGGRRGAQALSFLKFINWKDHSDKALRVRISRSVYFFLSFLPTSHIYIHIYPHPFLAFWLQPPPHTKIYICH